MNPYLPPGGCPSLWDDEGDCCEGCGACYPEDCTCEGGSYWEDSDVDHEAD